MNEKNLTFNDLDVLLLVNVLIKKKFFISFVTFFAAILSVFIALSIPNTYKSSIVLAPSAPNNTSSELGNLAQFSSLAGINIPTGGDSKSTEAQERIKSLDFFTNEFLPYIKPENLVAIKSWNREEDSIEYDKSIFDPIKKKWVIKKSWPLDKSRPTNQELYKSYKENLQIDENNDSGFITISFSSRSANLSKLWLDLIVANINNSMREIDKNTAQESIDFLQASKKDTNLQYMQEIFSRLTESQVQTLMLASSNKSYVLKIISPAYPSEQKDMPNRALICILGTLIGFVASCILTIAIYAIKRAKIEN
jgi:LPS O-antigen subunit length determinant protein (WzzB/FepE family)